MRAPLLILALSAATPVAAAPEYSFFPVKGVFYPTETGGSRIHGDFRAAITATEQDYFPSEFRRRFGSAASTISEQNYRRTYAVSLQVVRASLYEVSKVDHTSDIYAPVTASVYFSNLATGEVLYSATRTTIKVEKVLTERRGKERSPEFRELFRAAFLSVVNDLLGDAEAHMKPVTVSATVRREWKGLAILDSGKAAGIARDDVLTDDAGNELRVISAGSTYSIGVPELGTFTTSRRFSKLSNRTLAEIRKPRVLLLVDEAPEAFPQETLAALLGDALGSEAPISLVPVNRTFGAVLSAVSGQIALSKEKLSQREPPHFFLRVGVFPPLTYQRSTNLKYKQLRVTYALAYAQLVDRSGRILFATRSDDRIEDEITEGMAFSLQDRQEIAVKNAVLGLAHRLASELRFDTAQLDVTADGSGVLARDPHGFLARHAPVRIYRSIGKVDGISEEVRVPLWEADVAEVDASGARLALGLPIVQDAPVPASGDVVFLDGMGARRAGRATFAACGGVENLGTTELPEYGELSFNVLASSFPAPIYATELNQRVASLVNAGTGFREGLQLRAPTADYCIQPVYQIIREQPSCSGQACAVGAVIRMGYRVRKGGLGGEVKARSAMEAHLTGSALPEGTPEPGPTTALRIDILGQVVELASKAAANINHEQF